MIVESRINEKTRIDCTKYFAEYMATKYKMHDVLLRHNIEGRFTWLASVRHKSIHDCFDGSRSILQHFQTQPRIYKVFRVFVLAQMKDDTIVYRLEFHYWIN